MRQRANGFAAVVGIAAGVLSWLGIVGDADATDFTTGPALVVSPNKSIALYAVGANGRSVLRQKSAQAWQDTGHYAVVHYNSELSAAWFTSQIRINNLPETINNSLDHNLVCGSEALAAPPGQPQNSIKCLATNVTWNGGPDHLQEVDPSAPSQAHTLAWSWVRAATPAVISLGLDGSGAGRVYALTDYGSIVMGQIDAQHNHTDNYRYMTSILYSGSSVPIGLTGLGAALVNEGEGLRVMLCGVKSNSEYWCAKSTNANGTNFGAWQLLPGLWDRAPAVARWRTAFGDATKVHGLSNASQAIYTTTRFFGTWSPPSEVGGGALNPLSVGTISYANDPTVLQMFLRGGDGRIWSGTASDYGFSGWSQWLWQ
jgi:hypothetical protein